MNKIPTKCPNADVPAHVIVSSISAPCVCVTGTRPDIFALYCPFPDCVSLRPTERRRLTNVASLGVSSGFVKDRKHVCKQFYSSPGISEKLLADPLFR